MFCSDLHKNDKDIKMICVSSIDYLFSKVQLDDKGVGERCRKLKFFLRFHQDPSMSSSKQRVKGVSLHLHTTCRSRAEAFKGRVMMESYSP